MGDAVTREIERATGLLRGGLVIAATDVLIATLDELFLAGNWDEASAFLDTIPLGLDKEVLHPLRVYSKHAEKHIGPARQRFLERHFGGLERD